MSEDTEIVLAVDDTPQNIDVLSSVLRSHYKVKAALNGQKALEIARKEPRPDIILLDIMMPEMDGFEVCRQLKSDPDTAAIPVVFITAMTDAEDETLGLELGAVDYISKPINPAVVLSRVRTHLSIAAQQRAIAEKEALLRMALDNMPGAMWVVGPDLKLDMANDQYKDFYGDPDGIVRPGTAIKDILRKEAEGGLLGEGPSVEAIVAERLESFRAREETSFEDTTPDGRNVRLVRRPTDDGFIISVATDITQQKKAEREIETQRAQLDSIMTNISQGILLFDQDQKLVRWNARYPELLDIDEKFLHPGMSLYGLALFFAKRGSYGEGELETIAENRVEALWQDRSQADVAYVNDRVFDAQSTRTPDGGLVITYTDITERKKSEKIIADAMKLINESIAYASRIQRSVLPTQGQMEEVFTDHFAIWEPKDVVGGDVYLLRECKSGHLLFVADCTGHGVPGAFMSMIATGAFDQALIEIQSGDPAALLGRINQLVKLTLGQEGKDGESDDGFECGLCLLDRSGNAITYAGARFELWELKDGEMTVIKGDKPGIGYRRTPKDQDYTNHEIEVTGSAMYYLFSDGIIDQPGGPKHRAFGKKRLKSNLLDYYPMQLPKQAVHLMREFEEYQHKEARRDDMTLLGFVPRPFDDD